MKKGQILEGTVERIDFPNKGIVRTEEGTVIVKNAIPGQKVRFAINKKRKNRAEGRLLETLEKSPLETRPPQCSIFPECGGCMYQTMDYEEQLRMKEDQIRRLLDAAIAAGGQVDASGQPDYKFEGIRRSPREFAYRNKMEFSFGDEYKDGPLSLGLHKKGSTYDVLTAADCRIVHPDMNVILKCVLEYFRELENKACGTPETGEKNTAEIIQPGSGELCKNKSVRFFYHKMTHQGYLRHLLLRRAETTGEILVNLVTTSQQEYGLTPLMERLLALPLEGRIVGILHIINDSVADVVRSDETRILYGQDYFYETILGLRFKITPFSFFQTNSLGAEVLYNTAREYIGDTKDMTVFDLYSGTGTIAQILASVAREVIGVEIVEEAVGAAKENAALNGLTNCSFIAGDVLKVLDDLKEKPDFIVLDPPRDGIHPKALPKIIDYGVERLVYISCKPTSLARDLGVFLERGYRVERVCCVDMFPQTVHVECVTLLQKSNRKLRPDSYVKLSLDMEDYYRIKDAEGSTEIE